MENRWIDIALTEPTTVGGVRILSRSGSTQNGVIKKADIYVKTAGAEDYVKTAENAVFGTGWNSAVFDEIENVTNVKIQATETQGNWASAAEIRIVGAEKTVESKADKTALQAAVDAAKVLNEIDYTAESWAVLETKLAAAEAALAKEEATDYEVLLAEANLKSAVKLLVLDEEEGVYKVIVNGGEGTCKAVYNQRVTVEAAAPAEGQKFVGWYVDGKLIFKDADYTFYVSGDIVLDAVYADEDAEPVEMEAAAQVTNLLVVKSEDTKSDVRYVAQLVVPEGWKIAQAGLVWTAKEDVALVTDGSLNPDAKATYIKAISYTNQFSVTVKGMPEGRFLRGRVFAKLVKADGEVQWVYSDEYRAEAK